MLLTNFSIVAFVLFAGNVFCQTSVPVVVNVPTGKTNQSVAAGNDPRLENVLYDYQTVAGNAITDRLSGLTAAPGTYNIFSSIDTAYGTYFTRNTSLWAADLDITCMSPWNSKAATAEHGTLITPRHVVFAAHYSDPGNKIASVTITVGGSGYSHATATFGGGGGVFYPATPVVQITGGAVTGVIDFADGYGFTSPPNITITGDGTGATAMTSIVPYGSNPVVPGTTVLKFVDNANNIHTRTVVSCTDPVTPVTADICIGTLDSDLPSQITPAALLPASAISGGFFGPSNVLLATTNQFNGLHVAGSNVNGIPFVATMPNSAYSSWAATEIVGDSGSPVFMYVNGHWDLLWTMHYGGDGVTIVGSTGVSMPIVNYMTQLAATVAPYQLTVDTLYASGAIANVNPHAYYNAVSGVPASTLTGSNSQPVSTVPTSVPVKTSVLTTVPSPPTVTGVGSEATYDGSWG